MIDELIEEEYYDFNFLNMVSESLSQTPEDVKAKVDVEILTQNIYGDFGGFSHSFPVTRVNVDVEGQVAWKKDIRSVIDFGIFTVPRPGFEKKVRRAITKANKIAEVFNSAPINNPQK